MKQLVVLLVLICMSCAIPEADILEQTASERRPQVECGDAIIPEGVNRQDIIDRLNSTGEIVNGFSERQVIIGYDKNRRAIMFGHLINHLEGVQYNFTITDDRGNTSNGCVTFNTISAVEFFDFKSKAGIYTITFDDYPEVTRNYEFEITRGR